MVSYIKIMLGLFLTLILMFSPYTKTYSLSFAATETNPKVELTEVKKKANFKVLVPEDISKRWSLVIKPDPYPYSESNKINHLILTYLDKSYKDSIMVGIQQSKADKARITGRENNEKILDINGYEGYFSSFKPSKGNESPKGGILSWIQDGTYIEMNSTKLTENEIIELAKLMK